MFIHISYVWKFIHPISFWCIQFNYNLSRKFRSYNWGWGLGYVVMTSPINTWRRYCYIKIINLFPNIKWWVIGIGIIQIRIVDGVMRTLNNVRYILLDVIIQLKVEMTRDSITCMVQLSLAVSTLFFDDYLTRWWHAYASGSLSDKYMTLLSKRGLLGNQGIRLIFYKHCIFEKTKKRARSFSTALLIVHLVFLITSIHIYGVLQRFHLYMMTFLAKSGFVS